MLTREDLEYIRNYYKIDYGYRMRLKNLRARAEISSPQFDRIAGTGQHERDLMAEHAAAVDELELKYAYALMDYQDRVIRFADEIFHLSDWREMEILSLRYLDCCSWKKIISQMRTEANISPKSCYRLHRIAVQKICGEAVADPDPDDKDEDAAFMDDGVTEGAAHGELSSVL